jgi:hypothetical protein
MNDAMNQGDHQGRRRARPRRAGGLAAALAGTALLAAACSGGSSGGSPAAAGDTAYHKALAFAQCMRAHGEPGYPDPDSQGNFLVNGKKDHLNGALMQSAQKACQHLIPGSGVSSAQQRQLETRVLKFAACIRAHGVPDFPDPTVNSSGVSIQVGTGHSGHGGSLPPQFRSAMQACRKFLAGSGGGL